MNVMYTSFTIALHIKLLVFFQTTASESTFVSLLAARSEAIKRCRVSHPDLDPAEVNARLVAYCSDQVNK